jgi:hypothetical protein
MDAQVVGRLLVVVGAIIMCAGAVVLVADRVRFLSRLGRLPGDIVIHRGSLTVFLPLTTSLLLSVLLSVLFLMYNRR